MTRRSLALAALLAFLLAPPSVLRADDTAPPRKPSEEQIRQTVDRGAAFLAQAQAEDGSISSYVGIGPTALATLALIRNGKSIDDPQVAKALAFLEKYTQESGGVYTPGGHFSVYETCVATVCFREAMTHTDPERKKRYEAILQGAERYVRGTQWDEERGTERTDLWYGGAGYGGKSRPDLSNTAFLVEALKSCGAEAEDEALRKALSFVSKCQNLEGEHNTTEFAAKVNDGGFYYTCVLGGPDDERQTANGGLRSYGSMTYNGLKSLIYAGLEKDDPRLEAAVGWIRKYYSLDENPGMGEAGLYYYYHTFSKAFDALGVDEIEDASGATHDWRSELAAALISRQQEDGSWVNTNPRWLEGDPNLATAFALLSLSYCREKSE